MERKKLEPLASKLDHRINTIDVISRRCQNEKNFDISHLTKDAKDELSKIFVDFDANFLKTTNNTTGQGCNFFCKFCKDCSGYDTLWRI